MGCDIHLYAEKKIYNYPKDKKIKGVWVSLDRWMQRDDEASYAKRCLAVPHGQGFYTYGRNYNLFCALAGVRASHFNDDPPIISIPKGFPSNASRPVKALCKDYGSDGHSHSYLTLAELKAFDWSEYGETVKDFIEEVFPKLEAAKRDWPNQEEKDWRSDDEVRIVFWFDN